MPNMVIMVNMNQGTQQLMRCCAAAQNTPSMISTARQAAGLSRTCPTISLNCATSFAAGENKRCALFCPVGFAAARLLIIAGKNVFTTPCFKYFSGILTFHSLRVRLGGGSAPHLHHVIRATRGCSFCIPWNGHRYRGGRSDGHHHITQHIAASAQPTKPCCSSYLLSYYLFDVVFGSSHFHFYPCFPSYLISLVRMCNSPLPSFHLPTWRCWFLTGTAPSTIYFTV